MSSPSEPGPRHAPVRLLTSAGWMSGDLVVPAGGTIVDHLNRAGHFIRLAQATIEGHEEVLAFLAVQTDQIRLVIPPSGASVVVPPPPPQATVHEVAGVLPQALFHGKVRLASGQRVSDYFAAAPRFVAVTDCHVWVGTGTQARAEDAHELIFVHVPKVVAVSDALA